jgi:hypothetical protein
MAMENGMQRSAWPSDDRPDPRVEAQLHQHHQKRDRHDNLRQDERQHDETHDPPLHRKAIPRGRPRREKAEAGREDRHADRDDERIARGLVQRGGLQQEAEPLPGEALKREGDDRPVVEGKDRQQKDRRVEHEKIEQREQA